MKILEIFIAPETRQEVHILKTSVDRIIVFNDLLEVEPRRRIEADARRSNLADIFTRGPRYLHLLYFSTREPQYPVIIDQLKEVARLSREVARL